jgi:hypothetical protein
MAQQTPYEWYNQQMVNKQERERMTAVEWLWHHCNVSITRPSDEILEQAKAIEKEQITFAYNDGADAIVAGKYKSMEDYYNDMYQSRQDKTDK